MSLRPVLLLLLSSFLAACVSSGNIDPMRTSQGRDQARDAYIQLGIGYLRTGETERAKVPLKRALEIDSSNADAHAALALVFQIEMEPELADAHFRKAISQRSNDSRLLNNYGSFLFEQKRYDEAFQRYTEAAADTMYPERSRVFENLGRTSLKLNKREQAKAYFERTLRLNNRQPRALIELAQLCYEDGQYVPARNYFKSYSSQAEQDARSLLLGIRLAKVFEERDNAASLGLQLKRLYPGTPEYQQYLSEQ